MWVAAAEHALEVVSEKTLALGKPKRGRSTPNPAEVGGFISIVAPSYAVQLGIITSDADLWRLAAAFVRGLGGPPTSREAVTVMCELIELLAGLTCAAPSLRTLLPLDSQPQAFGVPLVARGAIDVPERALITTGRYLLEPSAVDLTVTLYARRSGERP